MRNKPLREDFWYYWWRKIESIKKDVENIPYTWDGFDRWQHKGHT
jgi:hypothetical protein